MQYRSLDSVAVIETSKKLRRRIEERFPHSGILKVCRDIVGIAEESGERAEWISKPIILLRFAIFVLIALSVGALVLLGQHVTIQHTDPTLSDFVQMLEAGINVGIFLFLGLYFLISLELRIKRRRALKAMHEIRALVHIVDMHQLTKDPGRLSANAKHTASSPKSEYGHYELTRFLDYCSEMLSLLGKIAALYAQHLDDHVVLDAVDEIEGLTGLMSGKIWQKIMILHQSAA